MIYRFDGYEVDTTRFEIRRRGATLPVEPQVLELLIMLIENRDHVVSRDELLEKIWKGRVVSDTTLSSRIKTARQTIGDDGAHQQYIKTIHGRGFRFVGAVRTNGAGEPTAEPLPHSGPTHERPVTRYARSADTHIAYHLFGSGAVNLVLTPGFVSHIDNYWDDPNLSDWLSRLARTTRIAMFDKRGTGMSDRVAALPGIDERMDDVRAVMDAVGFEAAFIMGISEGGSLATVFAAHHPERCEGLILYGAFAKFKYWLPDEVSVSNFFEYVENDWGTGKSLPQFAPSMSDDPAFVSWWGKFERLGATPGAAIALMRMNSQIDISHVLPGVHVPTLVIYRSEDVLIDAAAGRELAAHIDGARTVEFRGRDHLPWVGANRNEIVESVERFISEPSKSRRLDRVLATLLVVEIAPGGTHGRGTPGIAVEQLLDRFRATRSVTSDGGVTAAFDAPARALECAVAISRQLRQAHREYGIGVHTGEVEVGAGMAEGRAVSIASDVAHHARSEVLVSRTVSDLVAGSYSELEERGDFMLPSINQTWRLFRARR